MNYLSEYAETLELEKELRYSINECINEELGIADDVITASITIIYNIKRMINSLKSSPTQMDGTSLKEGKVDYTIWNKNIVIKFLYYNFYDVSYYKKYHDEIKKKYKNGVIGNTISLVIFAINNKIDPRTLNDTLYHELEHFFQKTMSGKPFGGAELYQQAETDKKSTNKYLRAFGNIVYLSRKYEQDAFVNGLYGLLTSHGKDSFDIDINYCVQQSDVFGALIELQKSYNMILNANKDDSEFIDALNKYKTFGYNYNRFTKEAFEAINEIKRKIARTIKKFKSDMDKINENNNSLYRKPYTTDRHLRYSEYHIKEL